MRAAQRPLACSPPRSPRLPPSLVSCSSSLFGPQATAPAPAAAALCSCQLTWRAAQRWRAATSCWWVLPSRVRAGQGFFATSLALVGWTASAARCACIIPALPHAHQWDGQHMPVTPPPHTKRHRPATARRPPPLPANPSGGLGAGGGAAAPGAARRRAQPWRASSASVAQSERGRA